MKALVIDCAVSKLSLAAKNDDKVCVTSYDIGMKQSEILVNAIDYVLSSVELKTSDLDYTAITIGPGSFTGLRLGISALKAIQLAYDVPVYGISSLETYAYSLKNVFNLPIISAIDAHKDCFYATITKNDDILLCEGDYPVEKICEEISKLNINELFITGPDSQKLKEIIQSKNSEIKLYYQNYQPICAESLFFITEEKIKKNDPPLQDYDGPVYLRASEAEIKLNS